MDLELEREVRAGVIIWESSENALGTGVAWVDEIMHGAEDKRGRRLKRMPLGKDGGHQHVQVEQRRTLKWKQKGAPREECLVEAKREEGCNSLSLI